MRHLAVATRRTGTKASLQYKYIKLMGNGQRVPHHRDEPDSAHTKRQKAEQGEPESRVSYGHGSVWSQR